MRPRDLNDSKHWRDRAAEMRTLADTMKESEPRQMMFDLAKDYDILADRADVRAKSDEKLQCKPSPVNRK